MKPWIFLTTVSPDWQGVGWQIRTAACLRAFSKCVPVHLICLIRPEHRPPTHDTTSFCSGVTCFHFPATSPIENPAPWPLVNPEPGAIYPDVLHRDLQPLANDLRSLAQKIEAHSIIVRGITSVGPLPFLLHNHPRVWLELDEWASKSVSSRSVIMARQGFPKIASKLQKSSESLSRLERAAWAHCDIASVCSRMEMESIRAMAPDTPLHVLPNVQPDVPAFPLAPPDPELRLLFVGALSFPPNLDALLYFARDILPEIRRQTERTVFLCIAGQTRQSKISHLKQALQSSRCEFQFTGYVQNLAPIYEQADLCIAPIRAGGGTRMKIIQAFTYGRPVVSTSFGAEGLEVEDGRELLLADHAQAFASACLRIKDEPGLANRLAMNARRRFEQSYSCEVLDGIVARLVHAPDNPTPSVAE
jgi:polysaccharide biosynthesis protein PslH